MSGICSSLSATAILVMASTYAAAGTACDDRLMASLHACEQIISTLRADKAGQMRVFGPDGTEFTAGQAQWMKSQLQLVAKACTDGDPAEASRRLEEVQILLKTHHCTFY